MQFQLSERGKSTVTFVTSPLPSPSFLIRNATIGNVVVHAYFYIVIYRIVVDPILEFPHIDSQ